VVASPDQAVMVQVPTKTVLRPSSTLQVMTMPPRAMASPGSMVRYRTSPSWIRLATLMILIRRTAPEGN